MEPATFSTKSTTAWIHISAPSLCCERSRPQAADHQVLVAIPDRSMAHRSTAISSQDLLRLSCRQLATLLAMDSNSRNKRLHRLEPILHRLRRSRPTWIRTTCRTYSPLSINRRHTRRRQLDTSLMPVHPHIHQISSNSTANRTPRIRTTRLSQA